MISLRLTARNVRSYADLDVDFGEGVLALVGPNGAGKSTICDLIDIALFADGARELAPLLRQGETEMLVALDFEHAGVEYHVERAYTNAGRGKATLDLVAFELDGPTRAPLSRETVAATQAELERILGFTRTTFRASAFCRQGDVRVFCEAQPRERKALLARILGLDLWDRLLELARVDQRKHAETIGGLEARAAAAEDLIAERDERTHALTVAALAFTSAQDELAIGETALKNFQKELADARTLYERRGTFEAELARLHSELARLNEILVAGEQALGQRPRIAAEISTLEPQVETIPALQEALKTGRQLQQDFTTKRLERESLLAAAKSAAEHTQTQFDRAQDLTARPVGTSRCDRCQQVLGVEARDAAVASLVAEAERSATEGQARKAEADQIDLPKAPPEDELTRIDAQLQRAIEANRQLAALRVILKDADLTISKVTVELGAKVADLRAQQVLKQTELDELPQVQPPQGSEAELTHKVLILREQQQKAHERVVLAREQIRAVDAAASLLAQIHGDLEQARGRGATLDLAEQAYGRNGVPALIVESRAVPQLEAQANDVLERWAAPYRVELRTQRELKGGGVAEALDIVCLVGAGERPFESFSGGEKTRIALAVRIGLARLLARRRGANSRLLVIDEPEGLDAEGMARLPDLLESLQSEYGLILVVSHQPQLATAFPRVLRVWKDGGVSRVDASVEAVAA